MKMKTEAFEVQENESDPVERDAVLQFWFEETDPKQRFSSSASFDAKITQQFAGRLNQIMEDTTDSWKNSPEEALAAIIVLDQFSRNIYRGDAKSFAQDQKALEIAQYAVENGFDKEIAESERMFIYMPFMHSEDMKMQEKSLQLFTELGNENSLKYAQIHHDDIKKDGRFTYRDEVLGREEDVTESSAQDNNNPEEESKEAV